MKREKPSRLLEDVAICHAMGWTADQLYSQPARFVERLTLYLQTLEGVRVREGRRLEDEIRRIRERSFRV